MQTPLTNMAPAYTLIPAGVTQGQLDKAFQASDPVNGNSFISSGKDMLVVWNQVPTAPAWAASTVYALGAQILDPDGHIQQVTTAGTSGATIPTFNDSGGTTIDGTVVWTDQGAASATQTFGIMSAADQFGRYAPVTYTVAPNAHAFVIITSQSIYTQATGLVLLSSTSANLKFLPITGA